MALDDLEDIRAFIQKDSPKNALEEMGRIFSLIDSLGEFPNLGKIASEKFTPPIRQLLSGNYRIIYRIVDGVAEVLSITHGSRQMDLDKRLLEPEAHYGNFIHELTLEEETKVRKGLKDIEEGRIYTHEEIKQRMDGGLSRPKER